MKKHQSQKNYSVNEGITQKELLISIKESLIAGGAGFLLLLFMTMLAKTLVYILKINESFVVTGNDFVISFWGFLIFSFIMFIAKNKSRLNVK